MILPFNGQKRIQCTVRIILWLSILGMILATYLTYNHYKVDAESFCSISQVINCDIVNKSIYAEIFGIPVAILGFLTYLFFAAVSLLLLNYSDFEKTYSRITTYDLHWLVFFVAIIGVGFSLWLTYVEAYLLKTWCPLCVLSLLLLISIFVLAIYTIFLDYYDRKHKKTMNPQGKYIIKKGKVCEFC